MQCWGFFFFAKAILQAYDRIRVPRANFMAARSKMAGDIYQGHGPSGPSPEGRGADLELIWDPVWHHDINADIETCVRWLEGGDLRLIISMFWPKLRQT